MTSEEWEAEAERAESVLVDLVNGLADDNFDLVRCQDIHGNQRTGVMVGGKVLVVVLPEEQQTPLRSGTETMQ